MKKVLLSVVFAATYLFTSGQTKLAPYIPLSEKLNEEYCTGLFKTQDAVYFDLLSDKTAASTIVYTNILEWLDGRVAGLQVYKARDNTFIPIIRGSLAGIYVDEIYRDPEFLATLPISDIAMVKIIKGPFWGGFNSTGGAIAIYTIKGDEEE